MKPWLKIDTRLKPKLHRSYAASMRHCKSEVKIFASLGLSSFVGDHGKPLFLVSQTPRALLCQAFNGKVPASRAYARPRTPQV